MRGATGDRRSAPDDPPFDRAYDSYLTTPGGSWSEEAWQGFFVALQGALPQARWSRVPKKRGGFYGFYWHGETSHDGIESYLALQQDPRSNTAKLCVKISVTAADARVKQRAEWHAAMLKAAAALRYPPQKPGRFGRGYDMVVAEFVGDPITFKEGHLDHSATTEHLHQAEPILDDARARIG